MEEIYAIFSGKYSDWNVEGFVYTKEEAEKICIHHNESTANGSYNSDEWYARPVNRFDVIPKVEVRYVQTVLFDKMVNGHWEMRKEKDRYSAYSLMEFKKHAKAKIYYYKQHSKIIVVEIPQNTPYRRKAEKIAQDMLAKFLYDEQQF